MICVTWLVPTIIIILRATLVFCNCYQNMLQILYISNITFVHLYFKFVFAIIILSEKSVYLSIFISNLSLTSFLKNLI